VREESPALGVRMEEWLVGQVFDAEEDDRNK